MVVGRIGLFRAGLFLLLLSLFISFSADRHPAFSEVRASADSGGDAGDILAADDGAGSGVYIIELEDPPLASYKGGIQGLTPTSVKATGKRRLDLRSAESRAYLGHLAEKRNGALKAVEGIVGKSLEVVYTYETTFNGMAVRMTEQEAAAAASAPGVKRVFKDFKRYLHTDAGPQWIGAPGVWDGTGTGGLGDTFGEGVIVGVLDLGINPSNPSFAGGGPKDGYNHVNPWGAGNYVGVCDPGDPNYDNTFACNDKLIGAWNKTDPAVPGNSATAKDVGGHGSHTASTAAGNQADVSVAGIPRTISGVARHANIVAYRVCLADDVGGGGCPMAAILAGIDQAVADGVDVINYSIGGGASNIWGDPDSMAFLAAREAGVFVANSAGNNGPGAATMGSPGNSPWVLTVGASTHDREFRTSLTGLTGDGGASLPDIQGQSGTGGPYGPVSIVYAGDAPYNDAQCLHVAAGTWSGQIVVCDRGTGGRIAKGQNVLDSGAGGYVLANNAANAETLDPDNHVLPAVHISYADGVALKNWIAATANPMASISAVSVETSNAYGDVMASFSSRGPNPEITGVDDVIKPDATAPGVGILAASGVNDPNPAVWELMSGTSMASPHAAGAAALLRALHPDWTPAEIQSALMSTAAAYPVKEDGATPGDPFDYGAGRIDVSAASRAGFVLDIDPGDFYAADPALGGDPSSLNLASLGKVPAVGVETWTRTLRSTRASGVTWTASVVNPPGVALTVSPSNFMLAAGATRQVTVTADVTGASLGWAMGRVVFTPSTGGIPAAHFPAAVKVAQSAIPSTMTVDGLAPNGNAVAHGVKVNDEITDLTVTEACLVPADLYEFGVVQDPDNGSVFDHWPPDPLVHGVWYLEHTVAEGARRLVADMIETTSPDVDLLVYYWNGVSWQLPCASANSGSDEYCNIDNPPAGLYWIIVQNWKATDPTGSTPDQVTLAVAEVPGESCGNLDAAVAGGGTVPAGEEFDLNLSWNLGGSSEYWYGAYDLGTDGSNPGNLGTYNLDVHITGSSLPIPTVSEWGIALLLILVAAAAAYRIRRRRAS